MLVSPPFFFFLIPSKGVFLEEPAVYRITVQGVIPEGWSDRLGGMRITSFPGDQTTLEGWLPDQAALKGVLDTLYDLHLTLKTVTRREVPVG